MSQANEVAAPIVTVITSTYNRSQVLRLALESVINQHFRDFEALVIGDGCTDDSEAVVASFGDPRLRWLNLPENSGSQSTPNNVGLRLARGRYVAFLSHDDLWLPWHLSGLVDFITESRADLVHSLMAFVGPNGVRYGLGPPRGDVPYSEHGFSPSSWLHRRDLVAACGGWAQPGDLPWAIDFDFTRRVAIARKEIAFHPRLTVLKFPAGWFEHSYANADEPIQGAYFQRIKRNPDRLERHLLLRLAIAGARNERGLGYGPFRRPRTRSWREALEAVVWPLRRRLVDGFGYERGMFAGYRRRRQQRKRAARRVSRGLPPLRR